MKTAPTAFVSHNAADKRLAEELARALRERGVDAWLDKWEIAPGDSLVQKVFEDGLSDCAVFVVLLSPESVASKWVQHELDVALIRRIQEKTRVVPVIVRRCEIPEALKPLLYLDATTGLDQVIADLADAAHGRWSSRKPPVTASTIEPSDVPEFSGHAWALAKKLLPLLLEDGAPGWHGTEVVAEGLALTPQQFEDAVDELREAQLIKFSGHFGTDDPFNFGRLLPTVNLAVKMQEAGRLDFDLVRDLKTVAAAVAAEESVSAEELHSRTGLSVTRLHLAVDLVDGHGIARVARYLGGTYAFAQIDATSATRRWVREHAN